MLRLTATETETVTDHPVVPKNCALTTRGCALRPRSYAPKLRSYELKLRSYAPRPTDCGQKTKSYEQRRRDCVLKANRQSVLLYGLFPFSLKAISRMVATFQGNRTTWLSVGNQAIRRLSGLFMTTMDHFPSYTQNLEVAKILVHLLFPVVFSALATLIFLFTLVSYYTKLLCSI